MARCCRGRDAGLLSGPAPRARPQPQSGGPEPGACPGRAAAHLARGEEGVVFGAHVDARHPRLVTLKVLRGGFKGVWGGCGWSLAASGGLGGWVGGGSGRFGRCKAAVGGEALGSARRGRPQQSSRGCFSPQKTAPNRPQTTPGGTDSTPQIGSAPHGCCPVFGLGVARAGWVGAPRSFQEVRGRWCV